MWSVYIRIYTHTGSWEQQHPAKATQDVNQPPALRHVSSEHWSQTGLTWSQPLVSVEANISLL